MYEKINTAEDEKNRSQMREGWSKVALLWDLGLTFTVTGSFKFFLIKWGITKLIIGSICSVLTAYIGFSPIYTQTIL